MVDTRYSRGGSFVYEPLFDLSRGERIFGDDK
jgi:hypothetical protein